MRRQFLAMTVGCCGRPSLPAGVLPEDRADTLYHYYDGGGVQIDGPSILVRKNIKDTMSVFGNYYVDSISSASIDVVTTGASEYSEERDEFTVGMDFLHEDTIMSMELHGQCGERLQGAVSESRHCTGNFWRYDDRDDGLRPGCG